ncbi:MAG: N-acetylmuramoyl-L-alanine amidase [Candidatus Neomarinimicrobiota bacterium]
MKLKLTILAAFLIFLSSRSFSQNLIFVNPAPKNPHVEVKIVNIGQIDYFSLQDMADAFDVRTYYRKETGKILAFFPGRKVKLSVGSSFVAFDEMMMQMLGPVVLVDQDAFVPLTSFLELMNEYVISDLRYSVKKGKSSFKATEYSPPVLETVVQPPSKETKPAEPVRRKSLTEISYQEKANGILISVDADGGGFQDSDLSSFFQGEEWFYVTIYGAECDSAKLSKDYPFPSIERIEAVTQANSVQISLKLGRKFSSANVHYDATTHQVMVSLQFPLNRDILKKIESAKDSWKIDTIVLDAGHGGKDIGTPGRWGLDPEKEIVLDVVLRLGRLLEKRKDLKVVYTRDRDVFIPLWKRTDIANKNDGKLFLSIHVNAVPNHSKSPEGIELYLLSQGERSKEAVHVAQMENSVIQMEEAQDKEKYKGFDDSSFILANMVHSSYMQDSEKFAELFSKNITSKIQQKNRGVKQANFYVLIGASMPKVLVELGYNTSRSEAELLNQPRHRQLLAETLYKSIIEFKELSDKTIEQ